MSSVSSSDSQMTNAPQEAINEFWEGQITQRPAKVTKIFPPSLYANLLPPKRQTATSAGKSAAESYEAAASECRSRVKRIVRECHRTNEKFIDADFDIEDLSEKNCLQGLRYWYDDEPAVTVPSAISPQSLGSALSTLIQADVLMQNAAPVDFVAAAKLLTRASADDGDESRPGSVNPDLIRKVCVERNEECGVYGFVFYRDGEWIWTVVDDNLYLKYSDFDSYGDRYDPTGVKETKYKKNHQTGSEALYFASCSHENETWLPLLEKAYAKVHGDYDAIAGGVSGEAVEDLTGGVTTKILTDRILSKERLWKELLQVNDQFLFSASSPGSYGDDSHARRGLALSHAYSVLKAVDAKDEDGRNHRLVLIRNPWGKRANAAMGEWTGPWSDGSREWTPYWLHKLGHRFGDDGLFWMSYEDLLKRFDLLDRTRLFDQTWTVVQNWTSVSVAWVTGFLNTKFSIQVKKAGPTVFVLSQLDNRYFKGLEGKYDFDLHFILQEKGCEVGDYIVRARGAWFGNRSISADVDLEAGIYEVLPKIEASRDADAPDVQDVVVKLAEKNPQKLRQIGISYDIANAKGTSELSDEQKKKREQKRKENAVKKKKQIEEEAREKGGFEAWKKEEKAEYEARKREKARNSRDSPKKTTTDQEKEAKSEQDEAPAPGHAEENKPDASSPSTVQDIVTDDAIRAHIKPKTKTGNAREDEKETKDGTENSLLPKAEIQTAPPSMADSVGPSRSLYRGQSDNVYGDAPLQQQQQQQQSPPAPVDSTPRPWNAVCVLGLRVYSQDPETSIKLIKPKDLEEGAILDIDGDTPAGATM